MRPFKLGLLLIGWLVLAPITVPAQSTAFTYQGKLNDGANPANGSYDLQFALFDSLSDGTQIGSTLTRSGIVVSGGIFTVQLDYGVSAFSGANRFLQISVRPSSEGSFTLLSPRQQISSTPYAIRTLSAGTADALSSACIACVEDSQIHSVAGSKVTGEIPAAGVPFGSDNYIQNRTTAQTSANFNISGFGTVGLRLGVGTSSIPSARLQIASGGNADSLYTARFQSSPVWPGGGGILFDQGLTFGWKVHTQETGAATGTLRFTYINIGNGAPVAADTLVLNGSGRIGIGTANPFSSTRVHVVGGEGLNGVVSESVGFTGLDGRSTNGDGVRGTSVSGTGVYGFSDNLFGVYGSSSSGWAGYFNNKVYLLGPVGIGTESPERTLHVNGRARINEIPLAASSGTVCFNGQGDLLWCGASSLRLKRNVQPFSGGLDIVRRLRPISFDWRDGSGHDIGLGAEDVARIAPSLTLNDHNGEVAGVKYERLNILLINAVKEQQALIEKQQVEFNELKELVCRAQPGRRICKNGGKR